MFPDCKIVPTPSRKEHARLAELGDTLEMFSGLNPHNVDKGTRD